MTCFEIAGLERGFALAIISYNTFMHLNPQGMLDTLRQIAPYLHADGTLFIDPINPTRVDQTPNDGTLTLERKLVDPETGDVVLQMASNRIDAETQVLQITWIFDTVPAIGGALRRAIAEATYYYLFPHQLEMLLEEAGFRLESLAGDYDASPFGEESERLLLLAGLR
jgi:hypothetical protein